MKRATGSIFVFNVFVQAWNVQVCVHTIYRVDVSARTYHLKSRFIFRQIPFNVVCIKKGLLKSVLYIHIALQYGFLITVIIAEAGQFVETKFSLEQTPINWAVHYPYGTKVKKQFILLEISFNVKVVIPIVLIFQRFSNMVGLSGSTYCIQS